MKVLETERLTLRWLASDDAEFILALLNDPSWLTYIGDKGVRTLNDARDYISKGPVAMHARRGFGLYLAERNEDRLPMGVCGLLKRDGLDDVDLGFAFLPAFHGQGYAHEAAAAVVGYARDVLSLDRLVAITLPENLRSIRLLERLGLSFDNIIKFQVNEKELRLYAIDFKRTVTPRGIA